MRSLLIIGASVVSLAFSSTAHARPDLNAFVNRKVTDTPSLVAQVKRDPAVADRYRRHFAMNQREVVAYLGTLHRDKLENTGRYTVYSVPNDGHVKMHMERLKRGEAVFVDPKGRPTLIVKCGNPVVLGPNRDRARRANPLTVVPDDTISTRQLTMLTPREPETPMSDDLLAMMPMLPADVVAEVAPVGIPGAGEEAAMTFATAAVPASLLGGSALPYALGLPLLVPVLRSDGGGEAIAPVPEPTTLAALGLGLVAVSRRRRKA